MSDSPHAAPRKQADRSARTRTLLLDAAIEQIIQRGAATITSAQVAERAGVTRGAFQHHFKSPHDLYLAVIERGWLELVSAQQGFLAETSTGERRGDSGATMLREWIACMIVAYQRPAVVAAFQLMISRQGDELLISQQQSQLSTSERALDEGWIQSFGGDPQAARARHLVRDAILGGLGRRVIASRAEEEDRYEMLVAAARALLGL